MRTKLKEAVISAGVVPDLQVVRRGDCDFRTGTK